jgi:asparaginyl-tRNA synthetase
MQTIEPKKVGDLLRQWRQRRRLSQLDLAYDLEISQRHLSFLEIGRSQPSREMLLRLAEHLNIPLRERDTKKLEAIVPPFPRMHYDDAVKILQEGFTKGELESRFEWGGDFGAPDETYLSSQNDKPLMVHHYPAAVKAFYMARDPERPELALGVDVLAPEGYGEVIGGGERATSLEFLKEQIALHQLPQEAFEWYLDLRRYGSVPHAGFGMGIERCTAWMCGIEHIRETIPFPRMLYRIRP